MINENLKKKSIFNTYKIIGASVDEISSSKRKTEAKQNHTKNDI